MSGAQSLVDRTDELDWPARAYVYTTWGYALSRARSRAKKFQQRMWLYRGTLDGEPVWVVSWDPKRSVVKPLSVVSATVTDTNLGSSE